MRLSPKVTWGLAWTGLALVLAVPSADFLTGQFGRDSKTAVLTSDTQPVKTAAVEPVARTTTVTTIKTDKGVTIVPAGSTPPAGDAVDRYLSTGKPLPDYISDDAPKAVVPKPAAPRLELESKTEVASIAPQPVLPRMPLPAAARPGPMAGPPAPAPRTVETVAVPKLTVTVPKSSVEAPVIVDESTLTGAVTPRGPVPPAPIVDDTENWDNDADLRRYLERRGILDDGRSSRSSATVTERDNNYDPDGFYLNEGPNNDRTSRETRRERILRMLDEEDDGFTLF